FAAGPGAGDRRAARYAGRWLRGGVEADRQQGPLRPAPRRARPGADAGGRRPRPGPGQGARIGAGWRGRRGRRKVVGISRHQRTPRIHPRPPAPLLRRSVGPDAAVRSGGRGAPGIAGRLRPPAQGDRRIRAAARGGGIGRRQQADPQHPAQGRRRGAGRGRSSALLRGCRARTGFRGRRRDCRHRCRPARPRLRRRARPPRPPAPAGGRVLRPGHGQRRRPRRARQPPGAAAPAGGPAGQRGGDRASVGMKEGMKGIGNRAPTFHSPHSPHSPLLPVTGMNTSARLSSGSMRPVPRLIASVALYRAAGAAQAAVVQKVEVVGLDEAMRENVYRSLTLVDAIGRDVSGRRMAYLVREAEDEAREALQPFGYFSPVVEVGRDRDNGTVTITIDPGQPVRVVGFRVEVEGEGGDDDTLGEALAAFRPRPGDVFDSVLYDGSKAAITGTLAQRGYFDAQLLAHRVEVTRGKYRADIDLRWNSGERYALGAVTFEQDPAIIRPQLLQKLVTWEPGDPFEALHIDRLRTSLASLDY